MSSIRIAVAQRKRAKSRSGNLHAALSSSVALIVPMAILTFSPQSAYAVDECGPPVGGVVTCTGNNYPSPGIRYSVTSDLTLILDNPSLVAEKTTTGQGAVFVSGSGINDIVINALQFQSVQSTGILSNGIGAVNSGAAGSAVIRMDTGTVTASGSSPFPGALLASITNPAGTGNALITLNGGQASNTGAGQGASAQNSGMGNAAVTMTGGSVSSTTGTAMRAIITNTASSGAASVTIGGGSVTTSSGIGVLSQSELGSAGVTVTGGTVEVQSGTNPALSAIVNNAAGTGTASIAMSGGTVTNSGSGDSLFASNMGTGTYDISVTGGTVTGGSGAGAAIHGDAAAGGAIAIGSGAIVNAGGSGIALNQTGGAATITTAGTVTGNVNLGAFNNVLDITGGTINGNISGGGNTALSFDLGTGNSFTYGAAYATGGMADVAMNSGTAEINGIINTETLSIHSGVLILNNAANTATTGTTVGSGVLAVGDADNPMAQLTTSTLDVLSGGRLQGIGTIKSIVESAGVIAPGNATGTLTIAGDYIGTGGRLEIEAELGDDASPTDLLVITGNTSGSTNVQVINLGSAGAQTAEGIRIVQVDGASDGNLSLLGDYVLEGEQAVVGGAYAYRLYQGSVSAPGDGDWYLRSTLVSVDTGPDTPLYQAGVPIYEAYAGALLGFIDVGTLQQRVGNRSWTVLAQGADSISQETQWQPGLGIWAELRGFGGSFEPGTSTSDTDYDLSAWKLKAGIDMPLALAASGALIGGISVHYGTYSADVYSVFGTGSIDGTGAGVGGTLTWYGNTGFYVDGQAQVTWFDSDLHSSTAGVDLADGNDGVGYALSIETGQRFAIAPLWSMTPQAQLTYTSVDFDDFTDPFGAGVSLDGSDSVIGRLGITIDRNAEWEDAAGSVSRSHLYGIANLYYDFGDGSTVDVAGVSFDSENDELWGGVGIGGSLNFNNDKYSIFGEALAKTSLENFGDSHTINGTVGFRVRW